MKKYLLALWVCAACGDNQAAPDATTDAQPDSPQAPDAAVCNTAGYPPEVRALSVDLAADFPLTLDGAGARCDQIIRALTVADVTKRPPELAQLDAVGITGRCTHDDLLDREIVRLFAPMYAGKPMFHPVQDVLVHVSAANSVVFLHGDFLPAGAAPSASCRGAEEIGASMPGRQLGYSKYASCVPQGPGSYSIAENDVIEVGDEGFYLDDDGKLHRVRGVEVYLTPANVTDEIINSDSYCCLGEELDRCVGKLMLVDVVTGELLAAQPHCHTC